MLYFEDVPVEGPHRLGEATVSKADIVEFAEQFDPLPMHVDEAAAAEGDFDGLIASGFHTLCLSNRVVVTEFMQRLATVAGLGLDDLRWFGPVRPNDTLVVYCETIDKRISESRPGEGIVTNEITVKRDDELVLSYTSRGLVKRRSDD